MKKRCIANTIFANIFVVCMCNNICAQGAGRDSTIYVRNSAYFEGMLLLAPSASLNYELSITSHLTARLGFGTVPLFDSSTIQLGLPVLINSLIGSGNGKLEIGMGVVIPLTYSTIFPTASVSYRYQPVDGKFIFKVGWRPIFIPSGPESSLKSIFAASSIGVSAGVGF